jgi:hypothetical protein
VVVTIKQWRKGRGRRVARYTVIHDGVEVGVLSKHRDSRTERHPWTAFVGKGWDARFLARFWHQDYADPRQAAVDAILAIATRRPKRTPD